MPADGFSSYANSPNAPYERAVALAPSNAEIEVTTAIWINVEYPRITVLPVDSDVAVTVVPTMGELRLRIKKLISVKDSSGADYPLPAGIAAAVIGLY